MLPRHEEPVLPGRHAHLRHSAFVRDCAVRVRNYSRACGRVPVFCVRGDDRQEAGRLGHHPHAEAGRCLRVRGCRRVLGGNVARRGSVARRPDPARRRSTDRRRSTNRLRPGARKHRLPAVEALRVGGDEGHFGVVQRVRAGPPILVEGRRRPPRAGVIPHLHPPAVGAALCGAGDPDPDREAPPALDGRRRVPDDDARRVRLLDRRAGYAVLQSGSHCVHFIYHGPPLPPAALDLATGVATVVRRTAPSPRACPRRSHARGPSRGRAC